MGANYRKVEKTIISTGALIGATAGWEVDGNTTDNHTLCLMAASQTAGTVVIPISGLVEGDKINAFHLLGQVESAGGDVTIDLALRKLTVAAANPTDSLVASMTQLAHTDANDIVLDATNTIKSGLDVTVAANETYYLLLTGTTAGSTDVQIQGAVVHIRRTLHN